MGTIYVFCEDIRREHSYLNKFKMLITLSVKWIDFLVIPANSTRTHSLKNNVTFTSDGGPILDKEMDPNMLAAQHILRRRAHEQLKLSGKH